MASVKVRLDKRVIRVPADTEMSVDLLSALIQKHKDLKKKIYKPLEDAYEGDYKIFHEPRKPAWKPDNRIAVNFAKYISDTFNGFFIGIPIKNPLNVSLMYFAKFTAIRLSGFHAGLRGSWNIL